MGTFLLFRRSALEMVGDAKSPFDEGFPIFFNEVDLLKRMDEAGWPCCYTPDAQLYPHHGASTRQVRPNMIWESHLSLVRYFQKHLRGASRLWLGPLRLASIVMAYLRSGGVHAGFRP
jgi:GT2 family glycosyltransferase